MTTYYVKNGGNDSSSGLDDSNAWATISKVNSAVSTAGDDVYFKCDNQWDDEELNIDWGGVDTDNYAIVGAYYGSGTIGVSGNKPILDGNQNYPAGTPGDIWVGIIDIWSSYVIVQDIKVLESRGEGITTQGVYQDIIIRRCNVEWTGSSGIIFHTGLTNGLVEDCDVTGVQNNNQTGIVTINSDNITFQNNRSHDHIGGECYGAFKGNDTVLIQDNVGWDCPSGGIEITGSTNVIVRRNLIYLTDLSSYSACIGIMLGDIIGYTTNTNEAYNNLVANCYHGIDLYVVASTTDMTGINVYNNTVVDCDINFDIGGVSNTPSGNIKNNISWINEGGGVHTVVNANSNMTYDYNNWSSTPEVAAQGANDVTSSPLLSKANGWRTLTGDAIVGTEFALTSSSPGNGQGVDAGSPYDIGINSQNVDFTTDPPTIGTGNHASPPDMGAIPLNIPKVLIFA